MKAPPAPRKFRAALRRLQAKNFKVKAKVTTPTRAKLGIPKSATGFYPAAMEFGWRPHGTGKQRGARPYLRPALYNNKANIRSVAARTLRATINGLAGRLG